MDDGGYDVLADLDFPLEAHLSQAGQASLLYATALLTRLLTNAAC